MHTLEQRGPWLAWMTAASWQLAVLAVLVAVAAWLGRGASPRLRYYLWLLVLAKVFLPPGLTSPLSVGHWAVTPVAESAGLAALAAQPGPVFCQFQAEPVDAADDALGHLPVLHRRPSLSVLLMIAWAMGGLFFWILVAVRYAMITKVTRSARLMDEGPIRVALEQIAIELRLRRVPDLLVTQRVTSPFLLGTARPRIVLPQGLVGQLSDTELRAVLTHELVHCQRRDTWIGWLQVLAQSIFWFHPFLWWANRQLRHERECVCDDLVLRLGRITPRQYGEAIVRVLTESRGRSLVAGSLVGVFEPGARLQNRLEDIMNYEPIKREFTWASRLALALFAILFVPLAPSFAPAPLVAADASSASPAAEVAKKSFPQIIKTVPATGAIGVDPSLTEISLTFDRDMGKGMSWTGGAPLFPPTDEGRPARWTDERTCVLPVTLKKGAYYRLGINSTSYQNFRDAEGVPAPCSVIAFTTRGAAAVIERRVRVPKIVEIVPENGARDVDPELTSLQVTFDIPMGDGMSWTGGGPNFPQESPDGKKAAWSKDGRKCTLPVLLEAGHDYELGLNSARHINFQSKWGVPSEPIVYKCRTRDAKE